MQGAAWSAAKRGGPRHAAAALAPPRVREARPAVLDPAPPRVPEPWWVSLHTHLGWQPESSSCKVSKSASTRPGEATSCTEGGRWQISQSEGAAVRSDQIRSDQIRSDQPDLILGASKDGGEMVGAQGPAGPKAWVAHVEPPDVCRTLAQLRLATWTGGSLSAGLGERHVLLQAHLAKRMPARSRADDMRAAPLVVLIAKGTALPALRMQRCRRRSPTLLGISASSPPLSPLLPARTSSRAPRGPPCLTISSGGIGPCSSVRHLLARDERGGKGGAQGGGCRQVAASWHREVGIVIGRWRR